MSDQILLDYVADIVSAHVSNNSVSAHELPSLIESVYASLAGLGQAPEPVEEKLKPAISVRTSVKPDAIACLECGTKYKMLKRHLGADHGMTPAEYRARWNLPADYPMVAPDYAATRADLARKMGLGRKVGESPKTKAPTKRKKLGVAFGAVE